MFTQISAHEVMQLLAQWDTHEEAWHEAPMSSHEADDIAIGLVEAGMRTWASPGVPPVMRRSLYARIGRSGVCRCAPESALENFRRMAGTTAPEFLEELRKEPGEDDEEWLAFCRRLRAEMLA